MSVKRMVFSATGTVAGLVGLLQFKTATATPTQPESLPSAALPSSSTTSAPAAATVPSTSASSTSAPSSSAPTSAATSTRTLTGSAESNQFGDVQVQVTVQGRQIVDVKFLQLTAYDRHSEEINSYAGPILLQQTLQAQSAQIDGVSGATYTTDSYLQSLQSALDKL